jgi:hypothetical protein
VLIFPTLPISFPWQPRVRFPLLGRRCCSWPPWPPATATAVPTIVLLSVLVLLKLAAVAAHARHRRQKNIINQIEVLFTVSYERIVMDKRTYFLRSNK